MNKPTDHTAGLVTGLGGVFFKTEDTEATQKWYEEHLGLGMVDSDTVGFWWRHDDDPDRRGHTVWGPFDMNSEHFGPGEAPFMFNYRVDDLDAILSRLRAEGIEVLDKREDSEFGRFGWIVDLDGHRVELWEPPEGT